MKAISDTEALERLRHLCSRGEKSPKEIEDKLRLWEYEGDYLYIIGVLTEENFMNEERFATSYVNDKVKYSKWGKVKIRFHLKNKGISNDVIDKYLGGFPEEDYASIMQSEMLKKNKALVEEDPYKRKQKLLAFGQQRGFEIDKLIRLVEDLMA